MSERTKTKRILAGLLCLFLIAGAVAVQPQEASAASADSATLLLTSMGVISPDANGSYNLGGTVTRGEFAKMLIMASPYKDLVATGVYSSPFKDVAASNAYAPYIRLAVSNKLMSGYSDGTFRPNASMTLPQGVNSVLTLLGYTQSDFSGAFPYAQMNTYSSLGLSKNISGGVGTTLSRGMAVNLLYNVMGATMKDGSQKYAEKLGYTVNGSGEVDYAGIVSDNMNGPYTVTAAGWMSTLGVSSSAVVYRNGTLASTGDVALYDILYYSGDKGTVWAYSDKVTGIYEKASPSQNAVTTVTVSGKEYTLESSAAFAALSSTGTLKIGDAVTLLLGKNGGVADAVSNETVNETVVVYVAETGKKTYVDQNGNNYTSNYIKGVTPSGAEAEYAVTASWVEAGDLVSIKFSGSTMQLSAVSASGLSGLANGSLMTIGGASVASGATIIDTYEGAWTATSMTRLSGLTLTGDNVLYYKAENGKVTQLILKNVTGDALRYGIVTSAKSTGSDMNLSGTYSYDIDGISQTLSTQSKTLNVGNGPAAFYGTGTEITSMRNLSSVSSKITEVTSSSVTAGGETYLYSPDVKVYTRNSSGTYKLSTLSAAVAAGSKCSFYYDFDKSVNTGARIRVIVIPQ